MAATAPPPPPCPTHPGRYTAGCTPCQQRSAWYNRRFRAHRRAGRWQPMIDVGQVRDHIGHLRAGGMLLTDIAEAAGIHPSHLNGILYDRRRQTVSPTVGDIILSLTPRPGQTKLIDPTGTRRRLRALQAAGWPLATIGARLGGHASLPGKWLTSPTVTRATAARVRDLYDELSTTPGPSAETRRRALAAGHQPPAEWRDDDIDSPDEPPAMLPDPGLVDEVAVERAARGDKSVARRLTSAERGRGRCETHRRARRRRPDRRPARHHHAVRPAPPPQSRQTRRRIAVSTTRKEPPVTTKDKDDRQIQPFAAVLQQIGKGATHTKLSELLNELTTAVNEHKKGGTLTVVIKVEPTKGTDTLTVSATSTLKAPQATEASIFFATDDGNLTRDDPNQLQLPLRTVTGKDQTA